ncbi:uncharacterized protein LTR77_003258 [Saxophila tyrrhenica]|uniref:Uncharacterized protein n=1 Tax=Saxophila tyrrhenica TaxID=1690608 RepID=A0AAV9PGV4_9PEZI|nr:hypothetical protein LTR77_003258 [Saxophila tyrrhenica]
MDDSGPSKRMRKANLATQAMNAFRGGRDEGVSRTGGTTNANPPRFWRTNPSSSPDPGSEGRPRRICGCVYCEFCDSRQGDASGQRVCHIHEDGVMRRTQYGINGHHCSEGVAIQNSSIVQPQSPYSQGTYNPNLQYSPPHQHHYPQQPPSPPPAQYGQSSYGADGYDPRSRTASSLTYPPPQLLYYGQSPYQQPQPQPDQGGYSSGYEQQQQQGYQGYQNQPPGYGQGYSPPPALMPRAATWPNEIVYCRYCGEALSR